MDANAFADLAAFTALPRVVDLVAAPDGSRLVATVSAPDDKRARYVPALWEIPLDGGVPARLTRSDKGESGAAVLPDGSLVFSSARPHSDQADDETALWRLPVVGEAAVFARRPGGLGGPVVAASAGKVLAAGTRLAGSTDADDAARRRTRRDRRINAILHTGMPIRYWDHELGDESPRLLLVDPADGAIVDLAPDAGFELTETSCTISADAATVATTWRPRGQHGRRRFQIAIIDVATRKRTLLAAGDVDWDRPVISPDGLIVAAAREPVATFETPVALDLALLPVDGGAARPLQLGDLWPIDWAWSPDSAVLYVSGDHHGRGSVVALDPATGAVIDRLAQDAVYTSLCPTGDGLFALRTSMDAAPAPVRLRPGGEPEVLPTPAPTPHLPGTVVEVQTGDVHSWLFTPPPGAEPAPVMLWIHGGPFGSWNAWSWRWNPWVAVARGWSVLLPDPALSTGYGPDPIARAWPYRAEVVWSDAEAALDDVLTRPELDATRTALLGASFGGYMTNWIAGHTERFGAIVTHAGLWALDQQHATTDAADFKTGVFGRLADHPDWYAANSPHNFAGRITTPLLVVHGNRDYRVPVSEALRLWWDLVSRWDGEAETMPHRFLQLTGENHWVLSPANAEIWYDTVLGFCAQHVRGEAWTPSNLL